MKDKNFDASKFLNDLNIKMKERKKSLFEMNLSNKTLENIYYMRNDLLSKLRAYDINYSKRLKLVNIVDIFYKLNIEGLTKEIIQNLIKCYCSSIDDIDYLSFMDRLILDIQNIMQYEIKQLKNEKTFRNSHSYKEINSLKATCKLELEVKDKSSDLNEIKREIKIIKYVFPQILQKNRAKQEQLITYRELMPCLKEFNIKYPVEKIIKLLKFLDLDPDKFSLNSMNTNLIGFNIINLACKIINNEIFTDDILNGIFSIKDAIFLSEKTPDELFSYYGSNKIIYRENFVKLIKTLNDNLTEVLIDAIFTYLTKMERPLSIEDFTTAFAPKNIDENFELSAIKRINDKLRQMHYNVEEYFDHLLSTKLNSTEKKLSKPEFYKAIKQDNYNFSSQEIVQLFKIFDKKCDNFVDREEFSEKIKSIYDPLFLIQDFIKKYKLDIEDVLIRMQIDKNKNCELDYTLFKMSLY